METAQKGNVSKGTYKIAAFSALAMIAFFLIMKLLNLVTIVEFRFLNFIIMFLGVRAILIQSRNENNGKLEFLHGIFTGFITAFFTSVFFAVFVFIYLNIDKSFMEYLKVTQPFGSYLSPGSASLVTIIEGVAAGSIISFAMIHLFNRDEDQG